MRSGMGPPDFPTARADGITACDVRHIDLADPRRVHALVFLGHGTRLLHVTGVTAHPTGPWTVQHARNPAAEPGARSITSLLDPRPGSEVHRVLRRGL